MYKIFNRTWCSFFLRIYSFCKGLIRMARSSTKVKTKLNHCLSYFTTCGYSLFTEYLYFVQFLGLRLGVNSSTCICSQTLTQRYTLCVLAKNSLWFWRLLLTWMVHQILVFICRYGRDLSALLSAISTCTFCISERITVLFLK